MVDEPKSRLYCTFIQYTIPRFKVRDDLIHSFAEQFHIPVPAAQRFATTIAEQCALLANRYEPEGAFTFEQLSAVETLGAEIGAAIISEFPSPEVEQRRSDADRSRAYGIGWPRMR